MTTERTSRMNSTRDLSSEPLSPPASLKALGHEIIAINQANGWGKVQPGTWEDTYKIPALLALIMSEAAEALEGFRKNDLANFEEELADILIRVLDLATGLDLDLDQAILRKMAKNKTRGYRHGGKRV